MTVLVINQPLGGELAVALHQPGLTAEVEFTSIGSLTVELEYLKRLIESIHSQSTSAWILPAVGLSPRIMDAADSDVHRTTRRSPPPVLDDSAFKLEVPRAQEGSESCEIDITL